MKEYTTTIYSRYGTRHGIQQNVDTNECTMDQELVDVVAYV